MNGSNGQRGGSRGGFRGGRGYRRGGGGDDHVNNGGGNPRYRHPHNERNQDRENSAERRQDRDHNRRNDNYSRQGSRSPTPSHNFSGIGYDDHRQSSHRNQDRERRHLSPEFRQLRLDDQSSFDRDSSRHTDGSHSRQNNRNLSPDRDRPRTMKISDKESAGEWKLKLADADEHVRRAEYELHRAKMSRDFVIAAYKEYTETTVPSELLTPKPAW